MCENCRRGSAGEVETGAEEGAIAGSERVWMWFVAANVVCARFVVVVYDMMCESEAAAFVRWDMSRGVGR